MCSFPRRDVPGVLALVALSFCLYTALGLRFDASPLSGYMQFIDRELLETRLLESIWYSHSQPPLLNLLAGVGLRLFGEQAGTFYAVVFYALAFLLALCVFHLAQRLAGSMPAAYVVTALLVFSPAYMLYANWFMYTLPAAALLALSAVALERYLASGRARWAVALFGLLALLALTRSLFHIIWLLAIVALLLTVLPGRRRTLLLTASVPVMVVALWYGKNLYYFGSFTASSTAGLGLSNITTLTVPRDELAEAIDRGRLSPFALVSRYTETDRLFASQDLAPTGIPVLDDVRKSSGQFNYNNLQMIEINRIYARDALAAAREFPFNYTLGIFVANRLFFSPSSMNEYFSPANRQAVAATEPAFNRLLYGASAEHRYMVQPHFGFEGQPSLEVNTGLGLIVAWLLVLPYAYLRARPAFRSGSDTDRYSPVLIGFLLFNVLYGYATSTLLELAENYRYKFLIEPLFMVLATVFAVELVRRLRRLLSRGAVPDVA